MKQTAVEWLYEQLNGLNKPILDDYFQIVFSKAKEIERQQIIEFTNDFIDKYTYGDYDGNVQKNKIIEEYYNETFKNK
jgi:hypothetical protein